MEEKHLTVSQINAYINKKMKFDVNLKNIYVKGEISNYKTYSSGHSYFTLKDKKSQISGVMFKGNKHSLKFEPKDGKFMKKMENISYMQQESPKTVLENYILHLNS